VGAIACGSYHSALLCHTGLVYTFGGGRYGKLGQGDERMRCAPTRVQGALGGRRAIQVACSSRATLVLVEAHCRGGSTSVFAFGEAAIACTGPRTETGSEVAGDTKAAHALLPVQIEALEGKHVASLAACGFHALAMTAPDPERPALGGAADPLQTGGSVYAWGSGEFGRLGLGDELPRSTPTRVPLLADIVNIAAGGCHSLACDAAGRAYAWGGGEHGATGLGVCTDQLLPVRVGGALAGRFVHRLAAGWSHSVFLADAEGGHCSEVFVCGNNDHRKLGLPPSAASLPHASRATDAAVRQHTVVFGGSFVPLITTDMTEADRDPAAIQPIIGTQQSAAVSVAASANASAYATPRRIPALQGLPVAAVASYNEHTIFLTEPDGPQLWLHERLGSSLRPREAQGWMQAPRIPGLQQLPPAMERLLYRQFIRASTACLPSMQGGIWPVEGPSAYVQTTKEAGEGKFGKTDDTEAANTLFAGTMPRAPVSEFPTEWSADKAAICSYKNGAVSNFAQALERALGSCDLLLLTRGRVPIPAHRAVLVRRSEYFRAALFAGFAPAAASPCGRCVLDLGDDVEPVTLRLLLDYLYTDRVPYAPPAQYVSLYSLADRVGLDNLRSVCAIRLRQSLSHSTAPALLTCAWNDLSVSPLLEVLVDYHVRHFDVLSKSAEFEQLPKEIIVAILKHRN
jgi:hypothetical protein